MITSKPRNVLCKKEKATKKVKPVKTEPSHNEIAEKKISH